MKQLAFDSLPFFTVVAYQPKAQRCILAAKEDGNVVAQQALRMTLWAGVEGYIRAFPSAPELALLPMPSRRSAIRRRGGDHLATLCRELVRSSRGRAITRQVFSYQRGVKDQSLLTPDERFANLHGAFFVSSQEVPYLRHKNLLLVDDLVTSGSTVREGIRALSEWDLSVSGVISACAAPIYF